MKKIFTNNLFLFEVLRIKIWRNPHYFVSNLWNYYFQDGNLFSGLYLYRNSYEFFLSYKKSTPIHHSEKWSNLHGIKDFHWKKTSASLCNLIVLKPRTLRVRKILEKNWKFQKRKIDIRNLLFKLEYKLIIFE